MGRGRDGEPKEDALRKLFVGGLSRETTDDDFRGYFGDFGDITDSVIIRDQEGRSKGFGFVTFSNDDQTNAVIRAKTDGHIINGKSVEVKRAIPRDAEPDQREKNSKMFVGGLDRSTREDAIKTYFEQSFNCTVDSVDLIYEKKDQVPAGQEPRPRGFAFVTINDFDTVDHICVIRRHTIDGKEVEVKKAAPKGGQGGGGGGGGGGGRGGGQGGGYGGGNQGYGGGNQGYGGQGGYGGGQGGGYGGGNQGYGGNQGGGYQGGGGGGYGGGQGGYGGGQGGYGGGGGGGYGGQGGGQHGGGNYGGGYQNSNFSGPDKGGRGGARGGGRGNYNGGRPY